SPLAAAGILRVVRGPSGGYRLNPPLGEVTLLEGVEAGGGPGRRRGGAGGGPGGGRGHPPPPGAGGQGARGGGRGLRRARRGVVRNGFRRVRLRDLLARRKGR